MNVPSDVWREIMSYYPQDLNNICLVSRLFRDTGTPLLYRTISIANERHPECVRCKVEAFFNTLMESEEKQRFVRSMDIGVCGCDAQQVSDHTRLVSRGIAHLVNLTDLNIEYCSCESSPQTAELDFGEEPLPQRLEELFCTIRFNTSMARLVKENYTRLRRLGITPRTDGSQPEPFELRPGQYFDSQHAIFSHHSVFLPWTYISIDLAEHEWEYCAEVFTKIKHAAIGQGPLGVHLIRLKDEIRWEIMSRGSLCLLPPQASTLTVYDDWDFCPSDVDLMQNKLGQLSSALAALPNLEKLVWDTEWRGYEEWPALHQYQCISQLGSRSNNNRIWIRIVDDVWAPAQDINDGQWMLGCVRDRTHLALDRLVQHFEELTKSNESLNRAVERYKESPERPCAFNVAKDFLMVGDALRLWNWAKLLKDESDPVNRFVNG
ncbi:hypothetical protein VNI00_017477 [Paramarasmius palmivorus]|uniref:F-box domain-containing protein n=1 Tax=Paramarasmius palmivorus TaxID=297713 RepID=A0AAW0B651_9AGAR